MNDLRRLGVILPAAALVVLLALLFVNRGALQELAFLRHGQAGDTGLVDQAPYETARTLAGLAVSAEEQSFAQDAERLADHEVDQAFQGALLEAELNQKPPKGEAAALAAKVAGLKAAVKSDQAALDAANAAAKAANAPATAGDDADVAQAQLGLDQDELADATADLARATGDKRGEIQQELSAREAAMKKFEGAGQQKKTAVAARGSLPPCWGG
jgi:hypothetical protein